MPGMSNFYLSWGASQSVKGETKDETEKKISILDKSGSISSMKHVRKKLDKVIVIFYPFLLFSLSVKLKSSMIFIYFFELVKNSYH